MSNLRSREGNDKLSGLKHGCFSQSIGFWLVVVSICQKLLDRIRISECEYTVGITITVLKIFQNNDNRGRHLEFYSHTGIGNWFQCFPVWSQFKFRFRIPDSGFSIRP